jgi:hypothetical protein
MPLSHLTDSFISLLALTYSFSIYVLSESRESVQGPGIVEIGQVGVIILPWFFPRGLFLYFSSSRFHCTIWARLSVGILGFVRLDTILYRSFLIYAVGVWVDFGIVKYFGI